MRRCGIWAWAAVCVGAIILLSLILPRDIFWFLVALALIYFGLRFIRGC